VTIGVEGLAKPIAARLMSAATGGQTLVTQGAFDLARRAEAGCRDGDAPLGGATHHNCHEGNPGINVTV
jgi:class 3 adenylate cyclase